MGKITFSVWQFTPRGYPSPMFFLRSLVPSPFQGVPQSQVLFQVTDPRSFLGGTLVLTRTVLWVSIIFFLGSQDVVPSNKDRTGVPPCQDWGIPPPRTEQQSEHLLCGGQCMSLVILAYTFFSD